jgi:hypothetical protein
VDFVLVLNVFVELFASGNVFIVIQYMDKSIDKLTQFSFLISANSK